MMSDDVFASVVICTHRRPESLRLLLESLCRQTWKGSEWELLVIDNDTTPSEKVKVVVESFNDQLPIRLLFDNVPNLSRARNLGIRDARGEYIAYLDDDCVAEIGWLEALIKGCKAYKPDFCAGPIYPLFRYKKPDWYLEEWGYHSYFGDKTMRTDGIPAGGNFIARRSLLCELGGFQESVGMSGKKIAYGEETGLVIRARNANPDLCVMYLVDLAVRHEMFPYKMTIGWNIKSAWAAGRDSYLVGMSESTKSSWQRLFKSITVRLCSLAAKACWLPVIIVLDSIRSEKIYWRRYVKKYMLPEIGGVSDGYYAAIGKLKGLGRRGCS